MSGLALRLLGAPEVTQHGEPVDGFRSAKARALLFYVAVIRQPQSRTRLAGLLWGDLPEENASANLRKTLTNLRKLAGPHLDITRDAVAINLANPPALDVQAFETALDRGDPARLQIAVDLYQGDFLEGFYVRQAPEFETWLLTERDRLRERLLAALQKLAEYETGRGQPVMAIAHAQRLLAMDPLREDIYRLLMSLFAQNGQRARALAQYEACAQRLADELNVEPGEETIALYRRIRDGVFDPPPLPAIPLHNLPASTTSFVGRERELAYIERWLGDQALAGNANRLLTIIGPGGVGKTRLAQQAAWSAVDDFGDGLWSVSLRSLQDASGLSATIAEALGISFFGHEDPQAQLVRYLRHKNLLLLLDNADQLVSQAFADFTLAILTQAPAVKIVVTSRRRLEMQAEQLLELSGLVYPDEEPAIAGSTYPAAQLFRQRIEGHGHRLPHGPEVDKAVYELCRLLDGLPLALELAATLVGSLSLSQIVAQIKRGLDSLATNLRDLPPRHRSMRAVFETSWQLLSREERRLMRQLAYFRGGFSIQAAASVVGARPTQLQALANKSLIRAQGDDRYDMHELIRHYASNKLANRPHEAQDVARRHARRLTHFLAARKAAIQGPEYQQASLEIAADAPNVRKAWEWAVAARSLEDIARSAETLHYYFLNTRSSFDEAAQRFENAARAIAGMPAMEADALAGRLLLKAAVNRRMLGQLEDARRLAEQSLSHFYRQELALDIARAASTLGVIRLQQSEKAGALRLAKTAVDQARDLDAPVDLCLCLNNLAYVLAHNGQTEAAIASAEESVELARHIDYPHGELSAMNMLGVYYQSTGEDAKARGVFETLVDRCRKTGTQSRLAQAVNNLGALYKKQGDSDKARPLLQEAVHLYEAVGQAHYAAFVRVLLGELALERGDVERSRRCCTHALQTAEEMEMPALAANALVLHARLLARQGKIDDAASVLALIAADPSALSDARNDARQELEALRDLMSPQAFDVAQDKGRRCTLHEITRQVLSIYAASVEEARAPFSTHPR
ncbi:MAG TPA: BTAD domain-containing putative transcriptional regulator [Candidatus Sulfomarinibacteraceae bacterium]|nr:BTAD domain-containing putative transcriptional regulator [Candidatus Sulfomarinibacteraceae bacterium]